MMVFFLSMIRKILIWQQFSRTWGSNFNSNVAAQKICGRVAVLKIHRKLTCRSSFYNDEGYKTEISFKIGPVREICLSTIFQNSQLVKVIKKGKPPRKFSLVCNLLKIL